MPKGLIQIAERAATLDERLDAKLVVSVDENNPAVHRRLNNWKESSAYGDDHLFDKRLLFDGVDIHTAVRAVGSVRWKNPEELPDWIGTLERLIESAQFVASVDDSGKHPFQEVLVPFVRVAHEGLQKVCRHLDLLTPAALEILEGSLLIKLSRICSRPLALELNVARLCGSLKGDTPRDRYFHFLTKLGTPGAMHDFFCEYSVAGRLAATQVDQWIDSTNEFLGRLFKDLQEITTRFANGHHPGKIVSIVDRLSDPHCGNRTSKQITFASGLKLLYKPKNLSIDAAFQNFLKWINSTEQLLQLKTFVILSRTTHGWVEFLSPLACEDSQQMRNYFERTGMLLCLFHALGANDCHMENLFACGEHPVFVDLETLLEVRPAVRTDTLQNSDEMAEEVSRLSLLRTGMLPKWIFGDAEAGGADFSGLTGGAAQQVPFRIPEWVDSETDRMRLEFKYATIESTPNQPKLRDSEATASIDLQQIEKGFRKMYRFLIESRDHRRMNGLLDQLLAGKVRYLHRSTAEYALILQKSLDPRFMKEGIDRSIHLDLLWRNLFLKNGESLWKMIRPERQALERLDIPFFTAETKCSSLLSNLHDIIPGIETESTADRLNQRLAALDEQSMKKQLLYLRAAISLRSSRYPVQMHDSEMSDVPLLGREELIRNARSIADNLKSWAIQAPDGSITWMGADYIPHVNQFTVTPIQNTFYSGKCGIAFFLAALHRFIPDQDYGSIAKKTVQTLRAHLLGEKANIQARAMQLGAMSGIASICWTLLRIGEFLEQDEFINDAATIASLITPEQIAKDRHLDFMGGCAGAILTLLSLHQSRPASEFLSRAEECGKHLLENSIRNPTQTRCWPTLRGEKLTGFSHGASGFAYALLRLFEATRKQEYRDAALQAFGYERSLFSTAHQNWPDLRLDSRKGKSDSRFMTGWCHGAPGIALARVGCLSKIDDCNITEEIETALNTTMRAGILSQDDICCGNFSRIETLLIASKRLGRPDLYQSALVTASKVVHHASKAGAFRLDPAIRDGLINPGFMKGIAGVGYGMLRLTDAGDSLPSPLLM